MSLDSVAFFQEHAHLVRDVRSHCLASLVFVAWDTLLTFDNEVEYMWSVPWKSKTKWLYLFFRYVILVAHVAFESALFYLTSGDAPLSTCRAWLIFVWIILQLSSTSSEFILALCAYALFNRNRFIALLLGALMTGELISAVWDAKALIAEVPLETVCILIYLPKRNMLYGSFVLATHSTLVWLILSKSLLAVRAGWGRTPLISVLLKEGCTYYGLVIIYFSISFMTILQADNRAISLFMWAISISATCSCRLIISLERLGKNLQTRSQAPVFTSEIEV